MRLMDSGFVFESHETFILEKIYNRIQEISETTYEESCFLYGLVQYFNPKKILEVGVAAGGSTCILLNAAKDMSKTVVHSVDISKKYYRDPSLLSGWKALELFPDHPRWHLHLDFDVAEIIAKRIKGGVDFLLLDSDHMHPAETLSFLAVFPYLSGSAVVVLHGVNLFTVPENSNSYGTKLLLDSVVADKVTPDNFKDDYIHPNIAAFQINEDTRKYISNVVRSLFFPWGMDVQEKVLQATDSIFQEKYQSELRSLYLKSVKQNQNLFRSSVDVHRPVVTFGQRLFTVKKELRAMFAMCTSSLMKKAGKLSKRKS